MTHRRHNRRGKQRKEGQTSCTPWPSPHSVISSQDKRKTDTRTREDATGALRRHDRAWKGSSGLEQGPKRPQQEWLPWEKRSNSSHPPPNVKIKRPRPSPNRNQQQAPGTPTVRTLSNSVFIAGARGERPARMSAQQEGAKGVGRRRWRSCRLGTGGRCGRAPRHDVWSPRSTLRMARQLSSLAIRARHT